MPFVLWTAIITAVFCTALGLFAYIKNPSSVANKSFALFNIALSVWTPTDLIKNISNPHTALVIYRLSQIGGCMLTIAYLVFMWEIAGYKNKWIYNLTKWSAIAFAFISQTSLMIAGIKFDLNNSNPIEEIHGPLYDLFSVFFVISLICAIVPILTNYKKFSGIRRKQVQHVMFAFTFGFLAAINFFANQINDKIPPLFYLLMMGMTSTYAIAIMKHRLMDITVIVRKTLIYSMVTGPLITIYIMTLSIFTHLFAGLAGYQTYLSSAVAAALISICFQPLRKRVQAFVDQKFFRQYVDREEKLYELSREVITHTTPESMGQALLHVIDEALHPKLGALYLRSRDGSGFVRVSATGLGELPPRMEDDNQLASYFKDHPQPFVQDASDSTAESHNTRGLTHTGRPAA